MNPKILVLGLLFFGCKPKEEAKPNISPQVKIEAKLVKVNPFTYEFTATASDREFDPLTYAWDFGNGQKKAGTETETATFEAGKKITITVTVSDGKSAPTDAKVEINTEFQTATIDESKKYQIIEGFGGFGAQNVYWSGGPFTSERFVNDLVTDMGVTIVRDEIPTGFEIENDNADPNVTDLSKYNLDKSIDGHHAPFARRVPHLKALYAAGVRKFIASVWSPAPWMKHNNRIDNGTPNNSAPGYNRTPNANTNQLKVENYEEFAEMCVAYCRIFKREIGVDIFALSVQNEPRFSQSYQSCVYDGDALRDLIKVVGRRFKKEGLITKLFLPEDVGFLDGVRGMTIPALNDADARQYVDIVATHGYAFDGIAPSSTDAKTWETMYGWGAQYNKQHWMTETSGFKNTLEGANDLAKAMYTAFRFGNVSAWVFWTFSTDKVDEYSLMSASGEKSKRYYVSKQFYKYIRPGAVRVEANSSASDVLTLAFSNNGVSTVVLINLSNSDKALKIAGGAAKYRVIKTGTTDDAKESEAIEKDGVFVVPAKGVTTLYSGN
ncbi:PKD domain-containing protein [Runella zeae]|uniref:PKD domain-containing protein n=1 Tax=Runella zeae TaxID=94255 RepID=UPI000406C280|nr:PKD domain-containing protein [Runella zeae]